MPVDPLIQLKVTSAVCSFFALASTAFRCYLRRERYWWDDACAFFSSLLLLVQIVAVFMHVPHPADLSHTDNIAAYYIMAASFYAIIWTARLSILYSVIRIDPNPYTRTHLHRVGMLFILVLLVMTAQLFWVCEPLATWKKALSPQCPLDKQVAICQLVTDILADLLLIAAPLRLIRGMSAQDGTRRRLMIIFSTSIVTTIVSLVHAALILTDGGTKVVVAALVEDTFSLIVSNLPVVVTFVLRKHHFADDAPSASSSSDAGQTGTSTFGWRVASRKTGMSSTEGSTGMWTTGMSMGLGVGVGTTGTVESDTARDVTTVNLRDFSTSTNAVVVDRTIGFGAIGREGRAGREREAEESEDEDADGPGDVKKRRLDVDGDAEGDGEGEGEGGGETEGGRQRQRQRQERSRGVVWVLPEKYEKRDERREDDDDS
ncbi:hypothetical protein BDW22DRAFT_662378 [Trametopsis cervina]|nr:hypothetical protein BDW22DRAFT_662378 [Trametopsis cervina]